MVFITYEKCVFGEGSSIDRVWLSEYVDLEERYKAHMIEAAEEMGVSVNRHWLNMMNREDWHPELSEEEYKKLKRKWLKFLKKNHFGSYIEQSGLATEQEVTHVFL